MLDMIQKLETNDALLASMTPRDVQRLLRFLRVSKAGMRLDTLAKLAASVAPDMVENMLTNNITATLLEAFYAWPDSWKLWTQQGSSEYLDTQTIEVVAQLGMIDKLRDTGGEYNLKHIPDATPITYNIYGYGSLASADLRTLRSDRLDYFDDMGDRFGRAAVSRLHESIYIDNLQSNPTVYDGNSLFDQTNHANDMDNAGDGVDLSYDNLVTGLRRIDAMVDSASEPLSAEKVFLIVGAHWRETADQLITNPNKPGTGDNDVNTIKGRIKGVVYSRKQGYDWYLAVDPKEIPGLMIDFFEGKQAPELEAEKSDSSFQFTHPGQQRWRIGHYYGFVWKYWQSIVRGSQNVA